MAKETGTGMDREIAEFEEPDSSKATGTGRTMVTVALLLAMAVAALEQTVVSTAMTSIIAQLKGTDIFPWVFSAYLLAATVTTPIYGKIADIWGRKRVLLFGLFVFALGSALSGMATSMPMLIGMRVIQGIGAGSLGPIVLTMMADMYTLQERAKVQGYFSAVWGVSSIAGPYVGGQLTDRLSWRWVFYITVPFAILAAYTLWRHVHEVPVKRTRTPIDWAGAGLLALGLSSILLAVLQGPQAHWSMVVMFALLGLVSLAVFVFVEIKAEDPVLPMDLLLHGPILAAVMGSFLIGALIFGIDTYVPLFVQGVRGGSAREAGEMVTPLFLAWAISVAFAARVVVRFGFRRTAVVGSCIIFVGIAMLAAGANWPEHSRLVFIIGLALVGMGMGPTSLSYVLGVQNIVEWNRRGVATSAVTFVRTIGGALGVGLLGASLGIEFASRLFAAGADKLDVAAALRPETHSLLLPEQLALVQASLGITLRDIFLMMLGISVLALICSSRLVATTEGSTVGRPETAEGDDAVDLARLSMEH